MTLNDATNAAALCAAANGAALNAIVRAAVNTDAIDVTVTAAAANAVVAASGMMARGAREFWLFFCFCCYGTLLLLRFTAVYSAAASKPTRMAAL